MSQFLLMSAIYIYIYIYTTQRLIPVSVDVKNMYRTATVNSNKEVSFFRCHIHMLHNSDGQFQRWSQLLSMSQTHVTQQWRSIPTMKSVSLHNYNSHNVQSVATIAWGGITWIACTTSSEVGAIHLHPHRSLPGSPLCWGVNNNHDSGKQRLTR